MKLIETLLPALLLAIPSQGSLQTVISSQDESLSVSGLGEKQIFHGTSLIIRPDYEGREAKNGTAIAANFYCYFGLRGYLSFGWWLPADTGADASRCRPSSKKFDWFEYTTEELKCDGNGCRVHMQNFDNVESPREPFFEEDYMFTTVTLGERNMDQLGWGLFDRKDGAFAFGTRRTLGAEHGTAEECKEALATLQAIQEERNITHLPFDLTDVCGKPNTRLANKMKWWL